MTEIYKDIPGYENRYQASDQGNFRSVDRINAIGKKLKGRSKKINLKKSGYVQVGLTKDGETKKEYLHRLVMLTFIGPTPEGLIVRHKNEVKNDNRLENLEYTTMRRALSLSKKNGSSEYTGVYFCKKKKKWIATINVDGKHKHLGSFTDEIEAADYYQKSLEDHKAGRRVEVKKETKEKIAAIKIARDLKNKKQRVEDSKEYRARVKGTKKYLSRKIYAAQRNSSKDRGHDMPEYELEQLREWLYSQPNFDQLFLEWTNSGHDTMLIPSVDRIDNSIGYTFSNIQLMTWQENCKKG